MRNLCDNERGTINAVYSVSFPTSPSFYRSIIDTMNSSEFRIQREDNIYEDHSITEDYDSPAEIVPYMFYYCKSSGCISRQRRDVNGATRAIPRIGPFAVQTLGHSVG